MYELNLYIFTSILTKIREGKAMMTKQIAIYVHVWIKPIYSYIHSYQN